MRWILTLISGILAYQTQAQPVSLHPENPHYLYFRNQPLLLLTSAEHYGAVINLEFNYRKYLHTLASQGMNYTRIFTGSYVEIPGSFGIKNNTLSPVAGSFIAPWQRTNIPGNFEDEGKFDFNKWNPDYFSRLHDFLQLADSLNILVEITFFCATYHDDTWNRHPFNPLNNINDLGEVSRQDINTLRNSRITHYQKELIKKLVHELNIYDNIFFEISNEPWADQPRNKGSLHKTLGSGDKDQWTMSKVVANQEAMSWQNEMSRTFRTKEAGLPKRHLLARNHCNFYDVLDDVGNELDIVNFHYAWPEAVQYNYGWNLPIGFDESGFAGDADTTYLQQAWAFVLSGGSIFNHLDYSFYCGYENGTGQNQAPGGGSENLRSQLNFLGRFIRSFDFVKMKPYYDSEWFHPGRILYCLAESGRNYALYLQGYGREYIEVNLPQGIYSYAIHNPDIATTLHEGSLSSEGKKIKIELPNSGRLVLEIRAKQP